MTRESKLESIALKALKPYVDDGDERLLLNRLLELFEDDRPKIRCDIALVVQWPNMLRERIEIR